MSTRPAPLPILTADDLAGFPNDGNRYEVIDGELFVTPPPSHAHQDVLASLFRLFDDAAEASGTGRVYIAPIGVRPVNRNEVQPDLLFIREERRHLLQGGMLAGAPDIAVEIISPSSAGYDRLFKRDYYEREGVAEYWIVDPMARTITQLALIGGAYVEVEPVAGRHTSTVLPNLTLDPTAVFARLD